jgi:4-hydroxy-3-methylbut-2-enyl diphosphate reductase
MNKKRIIKITPSAGFCFGVKRAIQMAYDLLEEQRTEVYSIGEIIHNPQVVERLSAKGLKVVKTPEEVPAGAFFLVRSHGMSPKVIEQLEEKGCKIIDATCPFVKGAQNAAKVFFEQGLTVVICGDPQHAEVIGIAGYANDEAVIVASAEEVDSLDVDKKRFGILSQTTQKIELLQSVVHRIIPKALYVAIRNTVCADSSKKQAEVRDLAVEVEVMVVIGGKNSSNTNKLVQISIAAGTPTYHIETEQELKQEWFKKVEKVGIAAGASTPQETIDKVVNELRRMN